MLLKAVKISAAQKSYPPPMDGGDCNARIPFEDSNRFEPLEKDVIAIKYVYD